MEILVFRHNGDILLMLDKSTIDEKKHPRQIAEMLQSKLAMNYQKDWNNIDFQGQLYVQHPSYEWYGDNGKIVLTGESHKVRNIMEEMFTVV